jgi:hypothetical protein
MLEISCRSVFAVGLGVLGDFSDLEPGLFQPAGEFSW